MTILQIKQKDKYAFDDHLVNDGTKIKFSY